MQLYNEPLSIVKILNKIKDNEVLLPDIQRKYVWDDVQIEKLFDSILNKFPLSIIMGAIVKDEKIKNSMKFYEFVRDFSEQKKEEGLNDFIPTSSTGKDFIAIIDGQQRLNSLYIGLMGSYWKYKNNGGWSKKSGNYDQKYLYIINKEQEEDDNGNINFHKDVTFKFYSEEEAKNATFPIFRVSNLLKFNTSVKLAFELQKDEYKNFPESFKEAIADIYEQINKEGVIPLYVEDFEFSDRILEIFIRTNSGGVKLTKSDLLMAITTQYWTEGNIREKFKEIIVKVKEQGFIIDSDYILTTSLLLLDKDIRLKIDNFNRDNVSEIEKNFENIKKAILQTFILLKRLYFSDSNIGSYLASKIVAYFIYINGLYDIGKEKNDGDSNHLNINKWYCLSILKRIFSGHTNSTMVRLRKIIKENVNMTFPFDAIRNNYKNDDINYELSDERLDELLMSEKGTLNCRTILNIITQVKNYENGFDEDHLHPYSLINTDNKISKIIKISEDIEFVKKYRNTCLNLWWLASSKNRSKQDQPLAEYVKEKNISMSEINLNDNTSLDLADFKEFINTRKKNIKELIDSIIK